MTAVEYASLRGKFSDQYAEIFDETMSSCVKNGYWPEKFLSEDLAAREVVTELTSLGEHEVLLSIIKKTFKKRK